MALLPLYQLSKVEKAKYKLHGSTYGTFCIFEDENGKRYLQIDTFGSRSRENPEKSSQSLQFDEDTIKFFMGLFNKD